MADLAARLDQAFEKRAQLTPKNVDDRLRADVDETIAMLDSGEARGTLYYAMELVEGADLSDVTRELSSSGDFDHAVSSASSKRRQQHPELFPDVPTIESAPAASGPAAKQQNIDIDAVARLQRQAGRLHCLAAPDCEREVPKRIVR